MGFQTSSSGFFFDGMEMVAAVSPHVDGGLDGLRGPLELLFEERGRVEASMGLVCALIEATLRTPTPKPVTVDAYRALLTGGVFEVVNRWSAIRDIKEVTRRQAWFYSGFGLGRAYTVTKGVGLFERLRDRAGQGTPLDQMPDNLRRMAAESAKQMEVAAAEDDLRGVRPLFEEIAARMKRAALHLQGNPSGIVFGTREAEDLEQVLEVSRKIELDLAQI